MFSKLKPLTNCPDHMTIQRRKWDHFTHNPTIIQSDAAINTMVPILDRAERTF